MLVMPIVYVRDMAAAVGFYAALGFRERRRSRSDTWVELEGEGGRIALHAAAPDQPEKGGAVELCLLATAPLEGVRRDLLERGVTSVGPVVDEAFGRSMVVTDPDGLPIQINEHDHELYT